jgi:uncharacterized membrane protein
VLVKKRNRTAEWVASLIEAAGLGVIAHGASLIYLPLGWLILGALLVLWGWTLTPRGQDAMSNAERGPEYR